MEEEINEWIIREVDGQSERRFCMSADKTWINQDTGCPVNPAGGTYLNQDAPVMLRRRRSDRIQEESSGKPFVDDNAGSVIQLQPGDRLRTNSGKILTIQNRLGKAKDNGEADVFLCKEDRSECVIKIFRRTMRNMEKKLDIFRNVKSVYIAPILDYGFYGDRYFEMYTYYPFGSLADEIRSRGFSSAELTDLIVPQLANAIHDLHKASIYHRDIKPDNILWADEAKRRIVLIDFGLSSCLRDPSAQKTLFVSQIGGTRAYEAPEVHDRLYLEESDYYSMGIVLYELFCRKTPVAVYTNRITRPEGMDPRLHRLILGLTYPDVANRKNKMDPNRRWTYSEIEKWLKGEDLPLPGTVQMSVGKSEQAAPGSIPAFFFMGTKYMDMDSLCLALGSDWENGKKCILRDERNALLQHLRRYGTTNEQASFASQIDDIINNTAYTPDLKLLHVIMELSPNHSYIACPLGCFSSMEALGKRLLACMRNKSRGMVSTAVEAMQTLLSTKELSTFAARQKCPRGVYQDIRWFESQLAQARWNRQKESIVYELAYFLSGDNCLDLHLPDGMVFRTVDELKEYMLHTCTKDEFKSLYRFSRFLLDSEHQMKPQVYGWMRQQGCLLEGFNQ